MPPRLSATGLPLPGIEEAPSDAARRPAVLLRMTLAVLLAGALVAGFALPVLGGVAKGTEYAADVFSPLESDLLAATPAGTKKPTQV